ncbi:MFS transporter [Paenibacillus thermotolerans]|uniref:MFS transporter n=1 Tax=Paenibacillus thermotolerans TaxID=3027807 RepID=UPI0023681A9D|nr:MULTISPECIES: MFS transporter [unclassified Paenibacillus]
MIEKPLFRSKPFLHLMGAQTVSNLGDWLDYLALFALVGLFWKTSPMGIAAIMLCFIGPIVFLGPFAGVLADRYERRTIMVISDLARVVLVLLLAFSSELWHICVLLVLKGVFEALFSPAKNGKLKEIVPDEQMQQAASFSAMIEQGAKIIGPTLGGLLVAAAGVKAAFYIDAATFAVSALILAGVPKRTARDAAEERKGGANSFMAEFKEGMAFIRGIPLLMFGTALLAAVLLVLQIADSQLIVLARLVPEVSVDAVGFAMAASGLGMILSAGAVSKLKFRSPLGFMAAGGALMGAMLASAALIVSSGGSALWLSPLFLIGGAAAGLVFIPFQSSAQRLTPEQYSGRVFGAVGSITMLATFIGPLLGGVLSTVYGVISAFFISGGLLVAIGIIVLCGKRLAERGVQHDAEGGRTV